MQLDCMDYLPNSAGFISGISNFAGPLAMWELQTGPTDYLNVMSVEGLMTSSNSGVSTQTVGLGIPAARGVGINSNIFVKENPYITDALPGCTLYSQWSIQPTASTNYLRRVSLNIQSNAATGLRIPILFNFPNGLKLAPSSSLVLWMIATNTPILMAPYDLSIIVDG